MNPGKDVPAELAQADWHRINRAKLRERVEKERLEGASYEVIRGVAVPVKPGMSALAKDLARKRQVKAMREDSRKAERLVRAIERAKLNHPSKEI